MDHILPFLVFLSIALVVSQAAPPPVVYWKKMLPNTKMPNAVKLSMPPEPDWVVKDGFHLHVRALRHMRHHPRHHRVDGDTDVSVGPMDGVGVLTKKDDDRNTYVNVGPVNGVGVHTKKKSDGHTDVDVGPINGVGVHTAKPGKGKTDVNVGWGGVTVKAGPEEKPNYVRVHPGFIPFDYRYSRHNKTNKDQEPGRSLFFLEKDMKFGHSMNLHFTPRTNEATFLTREKAQSLPFSSNKISTILREFAVEPDTEEAKVIEETIIGCKSEGIRGEQKYCATSLESLVDYVKSTLGKNVKAMSTEAKIIGNKVQNYKIGAMKKVAGDNNEAAVCHKQRYAYAVFYCHKTKGTSAYMVSLMSLNGSKAKAMAICHRDTSAWNPEHLAFQVLNVKPGSAPICHFLPEDHIVWISN